MKFTLVSFVALLAGTAMAAALPAPEAAPEAAAVLEARGKKDPSLPDPPKGKFSSVSQSCRGSQSSIRCCTSSQSNSQSSSKPKKVKFQNLEVAANCDQDISSMTPALSVLVVTGDDG